MSSSNRSRNRDSSSPSLGGNRSIGKENLRRQSLNSGVKYSDQQTLDIIHEFKQLYEDKMRVIDEEGNGDCSMQAKLNLQQDWIRDLTEQNEMLVRAVEELEQEATERVVSLEEKLKQSSKSAFEVMNGYKDISTNLEETFQRTGHLENDLQNIIELIRRYRQYGKWNADSLEFYTFNKADIIPNQDDSKMASDTSNSKSSKELKKKKKEIEDLEKKLEEALELNKTYIEEIGAANITSNNYASLQQSMLDMRDALTAEVADKHDTIVSLRRDVQLLEEQCRKGDQQTHFKDDIIKELRKEIKQLKHEKKSNRLTRCSPRRKSFSPQRTTLLEPYINPKQKSNGYRCPIKFHYNVEKYTDFDNHIVIFVCKDMKQKKAHRILKGDSMEVVFENPKIVHEYSTTYLNQLSACDVEAEKILSKTEFQSQQCFSIKNLDSSEVPVKDISHELEQASSTKQKPTSDISNQVTDTDDGSQKEHGKFEVINSYPPKKIDSVIVASKENARQLDYFHTNADSAYPQSPTKSNKPRSKFTSNYSHCVDYDEPLQFYEDLECPKSAKTIIKLKQYESLKDNINNSF